MTMTPINFISWYINKFEGLLSLDPDDKGNWYNNQLIGSKYGVTPVAFKAFTGKEPNKQMMRDLTLSDASKIALKLYYENTGIIKLPWNHVTASVLDKVWGSWLSGIKLLQKVIGVTPDGKIGDNTIKAFKDYISLKGEEPLAIAYAKARENFDMSINQPKFLNGWNNRTRSYLPNTPFWSKFND